MEVSKDNCPKIGKKRGISEMRKYLVKDESDGSGAEEPDQRQKSYKKPKHLNRKLATAQQSGDVEAMKSLLKQKQDLVETKSERISKWESLCKKLVGDDKWDQQKFDNLTQIGLSKKKLLEALGVEREKEKKKKKDKVSGSKRKTLSRQKKKQKKKIGAGEDVGAKP